MATRVGRGSNSGLEEAMSMIKALKRAATTKNARAAIVKVQSRGFEMFDEAIYGGRYGHSLASIFSKTRPRTADNKRSKFGKGLGTPVKTGRLQGSLMDPTDTFAIYQREVHKNGEMRVTYGGNPLDPKTGRAYFQSAEDMYGFFQDGLNKFEKSNTTKKLGEGLAQLFATAIRDEIVKEVRRAKR